MHLEGYCSIIQSKNFASLELWETAVAAYHLHLMHFTHLVHMQFCIVNKKHSEQWRGTCPVSCERSQAEQKGAQESVRILPDAKLVHSLRDVICRFFWFEVFAPGLQNWQNDLQFCESPFTVVLVKHGIFSVAHWSGQLQADWINSNDQGVHSTESCRHELDRGKWNQFDHGLSSQDRWQDILHSMSICVFWRVHNFGWRRVTIHDS